MFSDRVADFLADHKLLLGIFLLLLYAAGFNGQWRVEPDSALYLTLGRNIASGAGYSYQGTGQHLAFPGLPWLFAGLFKLFHTSSFLPALIMMPLFGLAGIALTYRLFLLHADRSTATVVTFGVATTRLFYRYCFELLTDMPFLVAVMAFLVGYEAIFFAPYRSDRPRRARWYDWALLVGGLAGAAVMRPVMWMLIAAILATLALKLFRSDTQKSPIVICMLLVIGAATSFYLFDVRREHGSRALGEYEEELFRGLPHFGELLHRAMFEFFPRIFQGTASQAVFGCRLPGFNQLVGVLLFGAIVYLFRTRVLWGMWVIGNIVLMLIVVKPLDRYFLPMLPLLIFVWWRTLQWVDRKIPQPHGWRLFLTFLLFGAGTNFSRIGEMIVEQRRQPFIKYFHNGDFARIEPVAKLVHDQTGPTEWTLVGPKLGRIVTLYGNRWATSTPERLHKRVLAPGKIWVLEPAGPEIENWLKINGFHPGEPAAAPIPGGREKPPWVLRRFERAPFPPTVVPAAPAPAPSSAPAAR